MRAELTALYEALLTNPRPVAQDLVVPSTSLFIEALPGTHPLLEGFKLEHRTLDVQKARADARGAELENLRSAARLLVEDYEDPDVERKIVIEGDAGGLAVFPETP
jgi:hypothetical protein